MYDGGVPRTLTSDIEAAREYNHVLDVLTSIRESKRGMHDVALAASPLCGDTTNNGSRKRKKNADKVSAHKPNTAYVLSDLVVSDMHTGRVRAIKRTTSRIVQRNTDGTVDANLTLAVASAVNNKRGTIKRGRNAKRDC